MVVDGVAAGQQAVVERGGDGGKDCARVGSGGQFAAGHGCLDARGPFGEAGVVERVQGGGGGDIASRRGGKGFEQRPLARVGEGPRHQAGVGEEIAAQRPGIGMGSEVSAISDSRSATTPTGVRQRR